MTESLDIVAISDTHGLHRELDVPDGDVLIHCGDITMYGEVDVYQDFNKWMGEQKHSVKIVVAGNHDIIFETKPDIAKKLITSAIYLQNTGIEFEGYRIWGSPYTPNVFPCYPEFGLTSRFVFNKNRGEPMAQVWKEIPLALDILITHGPPKLILDKTVNDDNAGCEALIGSVILKKPRVHTFGHIHEAYGVFKNMDTTFINCSVLNENYKLVNKPMEFTI